MTKFHVLYTTDHNYFPHMLTSIYSLAENNKNNNIKVHIIEDGFTDEDFYNLDQLNDLYDNIDIKRYNIDKIAELMKHFNIPKWRNTDIANARLFANEIIDETDKILYLDSDTIVVGDLKDLFDKKIQRPLAAVKETLIPEHINNLSFDYCSEKVEAYYNSGVLLFNYNAWDQENCLDDLYSASKIIHSNLIYPDQDLINLTFQNQIETLDLSYNIIPFANELGKHRLLARKFLKDRPFYYSFDEVISALNNPHILHTLHYLNTAVWEDNKIHPFTKEYEKYRKIWNGDFEPEKRKKNIIFDIPFISDCNVLAKTLLDDNSHNKIKKKILK